MFSTASADEWGQSWFAVLWLLRSLLCFQAHFPNRCPNSEGVVRKKKKEGKRLLSSVIDRCLFWFIGLVVTLATIRYEYIRARVVCKAWEKLETSVSWPERVAHMPCLSGWLIAWGNRSHCGVLTISRASSCSLTASHMTWIWAGHLHFVLLNRGFVSVSFIRTASPVRTIKEHWPPLLEMIYTTHKLL